MPEGAAFTEPLSHQTWRYPKVVAQVGIEPTIPELMRLVSLPRLVRATKSARLVFSRFVDVHPVEQEIGGGRVDSNSMPLGTLGFQDRDRTPSASALRIWRSPGDSNAELSASEADAFSS